MRFEEPDVDRLVVQRPVEQGLGVCLDRGQRRLELVRGVGDEVLPHPLEPAELGDVVEDQHGPRRRRAGQGRCRAPTRYRSWPRSEPSRPGSVELALVSARGRQAERRLDGLLDLGAADQLGDQPADRGRVEPEEPVGAGVGEQQAAAGVDGDHRLGHRPQHDAKLLPVLLQPGDPGLDLVRRRVEGPAPAGRPAPGRGKDRA